MSLNQKYTWKQFLEEHPEHKEKKTKRTSSEGKKAFESAYKAYVKKYIAERGERVDKIIESAKTKRDALTKKASEIRKTGKKARLTIANKKVGKADSAVAKHERFKEKNKVVQKNFK